MQASNTFTIKKKRKMKKQSDQKNNNLLLYMKENSHFIAPFVIQVLQARLGI